MIPVLNWEVMPGGNPIQRAKVIGGWLIIVEYIIDSPAVNVSVNGNTQTAPMGTVSNGQSVCFIPDPEHVWDKLAEIDFLITKQTVSTNPNG